ncbi:MAG: hypothetical protein MJ237_00950 [bacterium]|nr:hypothetical protein [bacterium]
MTLLPKKKGITNMDSFNSVSFKAKLDISGIRTNRRTWKRLADAFELKTKNYPNDLFCLTESKNGALSFGVANKKYGTDMQSYISKSLAGKILRLPDEEIISKLKKLYYTTKQVANMEYKADKFLKTSGFKDESAYYHIMYNDEIELINRSLGTDKLFKNNRDDVVINGFFL